MRTSFLLVLFYFAVVRCRILSKTDRLDLLIQDIGKYYIMKASLVFFFFFLFIFAECLKRAVSFIDVPLQEVFDYWWQFADLFSFESVAKFFKLRIAENVHRQQPLETNLSAFYEALILFRLSRIFMHTLLIEGLCSDVGQ